MESKSLIALISMGFTIIGLILIISDNNKKKVPTTDFGHNFPLRTVSDNDIKKALIVINIEKKLNEDATIKNDSLFYYKNTYQENDLEGNEHYLYTAYKLIGESDSVFLNFRVVVKSFELDFSKLKDTQVNIVELSRVQHQP